MCGLGHAKYIKLKMLIVVYENCISSLGLIKCAWHMRVCALLRLKIISFFSLTAVYFGSYFLFEKTTTSKQVYSNNHLLN